MRISDWSSDVCSSDLKSLEKELKALKVRLATGGAAAGGSQPQDEAVDVNGVKLIAKRVDDVQGGDLRNLADTFRSKLKSGVRSAERRVGKECVSTGRSRGSPYH